MVLGSAELYFSFKLSFFSKFLVIVVSEKLLLGPKRVCENWLLGPKPVCEKWLPGPKLVGENMLLGPKSVSGNLSPSHFQNWTPYSGD